MKQMSRLLRRIRSWKESSLNQKCRRHSLTFLSTINQVSKQEMRTASITFDAEKGARLYLWGFYGLSTQGFDHFPVRRLLALADWNLSFSSVAVHR